MIDEGSFVDSDGMTHTSFDHDIEGVPYSYPTCGLCGEWWPCEVVADVLHDDCRVETLPDGSVDEVHVFTDEEMKRLQEAINKALWQMQWASTTHSFPIEVWPTDLRLRGWGKDGSDD